ncbi:MAG: cellulase [Rhodospirillaceae bacterium]|nr:cellulase [Rhodospirillaceae bacterium]
MIGGGFLRLSAAALAAAVVLGGAAQAREVAVLQALDKITARISEVTVPINGHAGFGTLTIKVDACYRAPPDEPPENAAFLEISESRNDEPPTALFRGWMFSSSPGLSALEHPVYDISVIECRDVAEGGAPSDEATSQE